MQADRTEWALHKRSSGPMTSTLAQTTRFWLSRVFVTASDVCCDCHMRCPSMWQSHLSHIEQYIAGGARRCLHVVFVDSSDSPRFAALLPEPHDRLRCHIDCKVIRCGSLKSHDSHYTGTIANDILQFHEFPLIRNSLAATRD